MVLHEPQASVGPVASDLFAFDLSVFAYQLYNQSLVWPLDPFYEEWARPGSGRRDTVMALVHQAVAGRERYRGPGSTRGWATNTSLDPVLTDYSRVDPTRAVITNDGTSHRLIQTHDAITSQICETIVCEYESLVKGRPADPHFSHRLQHESEGTDRLYLFEGGTGSYDGQPQAWSLLGLVLDRTTAAGHEVHIAFRGSQSGDAYRAAYQGFVAEVGNPDWVTDMEFLKTVQDHRISPVGAVTLGLRDSILATFSSVVCCLTDIASRRATSPDSMHITGHSLGGALAVPLGSALSIGSLRAALPQPLREWPLDAIRIVTFGAQKSGDHEFADALSKRVDARRVWVAGDPIPEFPANEHVGEPVRLENGRVGTVNHEPTVTRRTLVDELHWQQEPIGDLADGYEPWRDFTDLGSALRAAAEQGCEIAKLFPPRPADDTMLLDAVAEAIGRSASYRVPWTKPWPERRRRRDRLRALFAQSTDALNRLPERLGDIRAVQPGSAEAYLRRWYVIREAARNEWSASALLADADIARALGTHRRRLARDSDAGRVVAFADGPEPNERDVARVNWILTMRRIHRRTVVDGSQDTYRRRVPPVSAMPKLVRSCSHYRGLGWLPQELMVPASIPPEGQLPLLYKAKYYGLGKVGFAAYASSPVRPDVPWDPSYPWNSAFLPPEDGWRDPTADETFVRLRLQGPNPFDLRQTDDGFILDFRDLFAGVLPPIVARFDVIGGELRPRQIEIGRHVHTPGEPTWDRAKRVVNAADIRVVPFLRHLLEVHFIVGQAFALGAYNLPTWHPLRPFMHFFSYGTLQVNDFAYRAFFESSSYFVASGFMTGDAAATLFQNRVAAFDMGLWNPVDDIERRGLADIPGHPYVEEALRVWPEFTGMIGRYLDEIGLTDEAIRADAHLDIWYRTLGTLIPNFDARSAPLDRSRLVELLASFLYNNVVHEVCGDLSPILRSDDPDDKAITNLSRLASALGDGRLDKPIPAPTMNDVFLMDQASDASRFNVGGNNLLDLTPERWVDEPRLAAAVVEMQRSLRRLDSEVDDRNRERGVRFGRMQPRNWEASIGF